MAQDGADIRVQLEGLEHCQELPVLVAEVGFHNGGNTLEMALDRLRQWCEL